MGYTEGGTMALNVVNWVDEPSMPPLQFAIPGEAFAEQSLTIAGNGLLPDLASYPQAIFTASEEITSENQWPVSHNLSSLDGEVGAQLGQIYQAQTPPDDVSPSTTSISNFQPPVNYSGSHHPDS